MIAEEHNKDLKQEILTAANDGKLEEKEEHPEPDESVQKSIDKRLKRNHNQQ